MATLVQAPDEVVAALHAKLLTAGSLPEKYRVLFSLRNVAGPAATRALIAGACCCVCVCVAPVRRSCCVSTPRRTPPAQAHARRATPTHPPTHPPTALGDSSDLFRHDVAFCLGQRQDPAAVDTLKALVADAGTHPM
jgi:deoxyhypusine monooxygenase